MRAGRREALGAKVTKTDVNGEKGVRRGETGKEGQIVETKEESEAVNRKRWEKERVRGLRNECRGCCGCGAENRSVSL